MGNSRGIEAESWQDELRQHGENGVKDIDGQRVAPDVLNGRFPLAFQEREEVGREAEE